MGARALIWFDPKEWERVRPLLADFDEGLACESVPMLPRFNGWGGHPYLPDSIADGDFAICVRGLDEFMDKTVGYPTQPFPAGVAQWSTADFGKFLRWVYPLQSPPVIDEPFRASWAAVAARLATPILVDQIESAESEHPGAECVGVMTLISARGEVRRCDYSLSVDARDRVREVVRNQLFAGRFEDIDMDAIFRSVSADPSLGLESVSTESPADVLCRHLARALSEADSEGRTGVSVADVDFPPARRDPADGPLASLRVSVLGKGEKLYQLGLAGEDSQGFICKVDHRPVPYTHPDTRAVSDYEQAADVWAEWVVAEAIRPPDEPKDADDPWDGDDVDSMLLRAEYKVVVYTDEECSTSWFSDAAELQQWADRALRTSTLQVEVSELAVESFISARFGGDFLQFHNYVRSAGDPGDVTLDSPGFDRMYFMQIMHPWLEPDTWFKAGEGLKEVGPYANVVMNGPLIQELHADVVMEMALIQDHFLDGPGVDHPNRWFVLRLVGSDTALVFPRRRAMLQICTDEDGATVAIRVRHEATRLAALTAEQRFETTWRTWLDADHPLDAAEIERGILHVEEALEHRLEQERLAEEKTS